ncbi:6-carboxytetrahydropterin synthase [Rhodocaloribacter litoris]|uniref:6-pyruvoyl trahydropterin synthase family protein n=1 Tax=Rhodocaloribacter litoris TaxID=2558931 RepID=UPI001421F72C|nr:6-carboxytetrahydropterin synthase [Rhodocaloribacter litoris]QXD16994.1 6-carboxytetrahydropterin synthase [Rhodocaloribacter litoris]GIV60009.1 MAG: 6-carboxytetrahydropterin synthase QueD [Rhodothermaceae bacterium]
MKVAKQFRWEGAHRLPWHEGLCRNLHGHSYRLTVELDGEPDTRGMLVDFQALKQMMAPLIDAWDHAILVAETDDELHDVVRRTGWKHALLPFDTTAENLCRYVADHLCTAHGPYLRERGVHTVRVRLAETETCYAEAERHVPVVVPQPRITHV